jgi:polysaccharide export outer membrane protein
MRLQLAVLLLAPIRPVPLYAQTTKAPAVQAPASPTKGDKAPSDKARIDKIDKEYRLGPEDVVHIQVLGRNDLSGNAAIDPSGNLNLPLLGMVEAANRTTSELGAQLSQRYGILAPQISEVLVTIAEYNSRRVTVVGEVRSPGRHAFREIPGLWDLLLEAGGPTPQADLSQVQIVRKEQEGDEPHVITVDLSAGVKGTNPDSLPKVRPQDTVIVPSTSGQAAATGATFEVLGSVRTPGVYHLTAAKTVVEALGISGGPLPDADLQHVHLARHAGSGVVAYQMDIEGLLQRGDLVTNLELKAGDTVTVPTRSGASFASTLLRYTPLVTVFTSLAFILRR